MYQVSSSLWFQIVGNKYQVYMEHDWNSVPRIIASRSSCPQSFHHSLACYQHGPCSESDCDDLERQWPRNKAGGRTMVHNLPYIIITVFTCKQPRRTVVQRATSSLVPAAPSLPFDDDGQRFVCGWGRRSWLSSRWYQSLNTQHALRRNK